jgi:hypothetical protein
MNEYQRLCELSRVNKGKKNVYIQLYDLGYDRCYKCLNLKTHSVSSKDLRDSASLRGNWMAESIEMPAKVAARSQA